MRTKHIELCLTLTFLRWKKRYLIEMWILTGVAHTSNPVSQQFVVDENAFPVLIQLLRTHPSPHIKVYTRLLCDIVKISINDFLKNNFYL